MKNKKKISRLKAYLILIVSGWRSIEWFGLPEKNKSVLITSGDGTIVDVAQYYNVNNEVCWQQGGISNELIPEHGNAEFWKPKPKAPYYYTGYKYKNW